jgi:hypothetical protein
VKRNFELIKDILLAIEDDAFDTKYQALNFDVGCIENYSQKQYDKKIIIDYHIRLIKEMNLTQFVVVHYFIGGNWSIEFTGNPMLTPAGHDLVASLQKDEVWNRLKSAGLKNFTFDELLGSLKDLGLEWIKNRITK